MDPVGKKAFAIHFTKHYSQIQKDFVEDDHEHSVSVSSDQHTHVIQRPCFS